VERAPDDLYQDSAFPNYHYMKSVLEGQELKTTMFRAAEPDNPDSKFEAKDSFVITAKRQRPVSVPVGAAKTKANSAKP
jgi:hypothetical protein